jgi:hypothetical protein
MKKLWTSLGAIFTAAALVFGAAYFVSTEDNGLTGGALLAVGCVLVGAYLAVEVWERYHRHHQGDCPPCPECADKEV